MLLIVKCAFCPLECLNVGVVGGLSFSWVADVVRQVEIQHFITPLQQRPMQ